MEKFVGDLSLLVRLDVMPPSTRLSCWWYLVIMFGPDPDNAGRSRQLMVLWSTKATPAILVSGHWWKPGSRMSIDEHGGHVIPGMVCAWWYDGKRMFEPLVIRECRMALVNDEHPLWPASGTGEGAGAIVPILDEDFSLGMRPGNEGFWLCLTSDPEARAEGAPTSYEADPTPRLTPPRTITDNNTVDALALGYDILRLQGTQRKIQVHDEE